MIAIIPYEPRLENDWNTFVSTSKNGTFMHRMAYMHYHAQRFTDSSLLFYNDDKLVALLPANRVDDVLYSHQGLTYGGLLLSPDVKSIIIEEVVDALGEYCRNEGITRLYYKPVPHIYHRQSSEEDIYFLFQRGATLLTRSLSSTICIADRLPYATLRKRMMNKADKTGVILSRSVDYDAFWEMLATRLDERHHVSPVHTLEEITQLAALFPNNIELHIATIDGEVVAGTVLYVTDLVTHAQYIAANDRGRDIGALDLLFDTLITDCITPYFDFGISTEQSGTILNHGLVAQKEGFGARGTVYDMYMLSYE